MKNNQNLFFKNSFVMPSAFMGLFSTYAWAQDAASTSGPGSQPGTAMSFLVQLPVFAGIFLLFYFALIRPQKQQQKKHAEFLSSLSKGQDVVTNSGLIGTVVGINDRIVTLDVSDGTEIKVLRSSVQGLLKESLTNTTPSVSTRGRT